MSLKIEDTLRKHSANSVSSGFFFVRRHNQLCFLQRALSCASFRMGPDELCKNCNLLPETKI